MREAIKERLELSNKVKDELLDNGIKILIDTSPTGTGKTYYSVVSNMKKNLNNLIYVDNHRTGFEVYQTLIRKFPTKFSFLLYGKTYELPNIQKHIFSIPNKCFCNLSKYDDGSDRYKGKSLMLKNWSIVKNQFTPSDFCSKICPLRFDCHYKRHKNDCYKQFDYAQNENINSMWVVQKSYHGTNEPDKILSVGDNTNLVIDENFLEMLYDDIVFNPFLMDTYLKLSSEAVDFNDELKELFDPITDLLYEIKKILMHSKHLKIDKKKEKLIKMINDLLSSYKVSSFETWNEKMTTTVSENPLDLDFYADKFYYNFTPDIIELLSDIDKLKTDKEKKSRIYIDEKTEKFGYIADKRPIMRSLIKDCHKVIINSSTIREDLFKLNLPEISQNYSYSFYDGKNIFTYPNYKKVYRYNKYKALYPKYSLYNKRKTQSRYGKSYTYYWDFTKSYERLIKLTKAILKRHKDQKILIFAFKNFLHNNKNKRLKLKTIPYQLNPIINKYNMDVKYEHWYNTQGTNEYEDRDVGILFGIPGKPEDYKNVIQSVFGYNDEQYYYSTVVSELIQASGRLRDFLYPNKKVLYQLSNIEISLLKQHYTTFKSITESKYSKFFNELTKYPNSDVKECLKYYNKYYKNIKYRRMSQLLNKWSGRFVKWKKVKNKKLFSII